MATTKATKTAVKKAATPAKAATKAPAKATAKKTAAESQPKAAEWKAPATHEEISRLAEQLWNERGRPHGSAHTDWHEAEHRLKS